MNRSPHVNENKHTKQDNKTDDRLLKGFFICSAFNRRFVLSQSARAIIPLRAPLRPVGLTVAPAMGLNLSANALERHSPTIITFDAPGAGTGPCQGTPTKHQPGGRDRGTYTDPNDVYHGLVRSRDGAFTTFDAPGPAQAPSRARAPTASTQQGAACGILR